MRLGSGLYWRSLRRRDQRTRRRAPRIAGGDGRDVDLGAVPFDVDVHPGEPAEIAIVGAACETCRGNLPVPPDPLHRAALRADERCALGDPGFEPGTSALSERRSNRLS